jgi:TolB protein
MTKNKCYKLVVVYFCDIVNKINFSLMKLLPLLIIILFFSNFSNHTIKGGSFIINDTLHYPEETHFKNIQQLTFGGDNAEAYWSYDGKSIVFQRTSVKDGVPCDQIFIGKVPQNGEPFTYKMVSSGKGRTTCAFFTEDNKHVIYASTHKGGDACPPVPDRSKYGNRYIWPVYESYDLFIIDIEGKQIKQLTNTPGYDAEATVSADGSKMIFTSIRGGDLDLYVMDLKTGKTTQVTDMLGYDGGAWFSRDGKKIVWRTSRPKTEEEIKEYKELLAEGLVAPTRMEVWTADADGKNARQITSLGQANWAPNFMPDGRIIFCSNHEYRKGFPFNMYTMNADGTNIEKVTRDKGFDAFPMFSPDGKKILFSSNRNNGGTNETNLFMAEWVD